MSVFGGLHGQTVTVKPVTSPTGWGGSGTLGTAVVYPCRIEMKQRIVSDREGKQRASQGRVIIEGDQPIGVDDQLTLSDGTHPPIVAIGRSPGLFGAGASTVVHF